MSNKSSKAKINKFFDHNSIELWSFDAIVKYILDDGLANEEAEVVKMAIDALEYVKKESTIKSKVKKVEKILEAMNKNDQQASTTSTPKAGITIKTRGIQINDSYLQNVYNESKITNVTGSSNEEKNPMSTRINVLRNLNQKEESQSSKAGSQVVMNNNGTVQNRLTTPLSLSTKRSLLSEMEPLTTKKLKKGHAIAAIIDGEEVQDDDNDEEEDRTLCQWAAIKNGRIVRHDRRQRDQIMGGWHDRRMARLLAVLNVNVAEKRL
ncbi:hypothetical protein BDC45DRAFT_565044 [Circinella umbellata]|nr:hypothetical protein BDC45DRAFT_565044 [Circinella umbellata]